jgi:dienelactone hydrolase
MPDRPPPVHAGAARLRTRVVRLALGAAAAVVARVPSVAAQPPRAVTDTAAVGTATTFVRALERGAWADAAAVSALVPPAGTTQVALLRGLWTQLVGQLGTLAALETGPVSSRGDSRIVDLGGRFDRSEVTLRVVLGPTGKVSGFWVTPPRPPAYTPPPYADTARVREQELTLGADPPLGATFTAPRAHAGAFPVAVLVHGSGPNDRDERVGANRPFRDLALGLASRGVAVLRYDKRTYAHPRSLAGRRVTVDAETIDDAVAAVALARALPGADPARVFVVGHSLGGMLAPEIAARDGRAAGVVLLAPGGRPLAETAGEQAEYLAGRARAAGQPTAPYDALRAQLGDLAARRVAPDVVVLGAPASYWYDLDDRRPLERARALRVPMLAVFGGRDYQVTAADVAAWRGAFAGRADAAVEVRPALNHLLVPGEAPSSPEEYATRPGHVEAALVERLASWMLATPAGRAGR